MNRKAQKAVLRRLLAECPAILRADDYTTLETVLKDMLSVVEQLKRGDHG